MLPEITFREGSAATTKVGLSLSTEIVLESSDPSWLRVSEDVMPQASDKGPVRHLHSGGARSRPSPFFIQGGGAPKPSPCRRFWYLGC